jgi:hypothetical protein
VSAYRQDERDLEAGAQSRITCHCGAVLADRIEGKTVVIDGVEFQYRRRSDLLTCPRCGTQHTMGDLLHSPPVDVPDTGLRRRRDDRS